MEISCTQDRGPSRNFTVRWFFDMDYGGCARSAPNFFWSFFSFSQKLTDTISYKFRLYIGLKKNKNFILIVKYKFILVKEFTKNNSKFFLYNQNKFVNLFQFQVFVHLYFYGT